MPVVQTYGARKVGLNQLPDVRLGAAETAESTGVGVAKAKQAGLEALATTGEKTAALGLNLYAQQQQERRAEALRQAEKARQLAIETNVTEGENALYGVIRGFYAPGGAMNAQGKDALPAHDAAMEAFDKAASEQAGKMMTPEAKLAFQKVTQNRRESVDVAMLKRADTEMQQYTAQQNEARLVNGTNAAIVAATQPDAQGHFQMEGARKELQDAGSVYATYAKSVGIPDEAIKLKLDAMQSAAYEGAINQFLADENPEAAQEALKATWTALDPTRRDDLKEKVNVGATTKQSQEAAAKILGEGGTEDEMLAKARAIANPKVQDETVVRIEHEVARKQAQQREVQRQRSIDAYNYVEKTNSLTNVPGWAELEGGTRSALLSYIRERAHKPDVETDLSVYYKHVQALSGPDAIAWAHNTNLMHDADKIGKSQLMQLMNAQGDILSGELKAGAKNAELNGILTNYQIVNSELSAANIDPTPKSPSQELKVNALRNKIDDAVIAEQQATGKPITPERVKEITRMHVTDAVLQRGVGYWAHYLPGGAEGPVKDVSKRINSLTLQDMTFDDRKKTTDYLVRNKKPVNDATILEAWKRAKLVEVTMAK